MGVGGTTMGTSFFVLRIAHQLVWGHHHWHQLLFYITKELLTFGEQLFNSKKKLVPMVFFGCCINLCWGTTIGTSFFFHKTKELHTKLWVREGGRVVWGGVHHHWQQLFLIEKKLVPMVAHPPPTNW